MRQWNIPLAPCKEARIRKFAVGLLALAAFAAAGMLLGKRRRYPAPLSIGGQDSQVDELYAAGL
jgi:hypothetical protein